MSRSALVIGGLLVAAVVAFLVVGRSPSTTDGSRTSSPTVGVSTTGSSSDGTSGAGTAVPPRLSDPTGAGSATGSGVAGATGSAGSGAGSGDPRVPTVTPLDDQPRGARDDVGSAAEYDVGGTHVRDHRAGAAPVDVPPNNYPPGAPQIPPTLTSELGQKVRAVITACAQTASREGRGPQPRIEGQFVTSIRAHQIQVTSAIVQPRDLGAEASAQLKQCVESKAIGVAAAAPDQGDLDNYPINFTIRLP